MRSNQFTYAVLEGDISHVAVTSGHHDIMAPTINSCILAQHIPEAKPHRLAAAAAGSKGAEHE
jgi:hypothetical protein